MQYIKVLWKQDDPLYPIVLYSELDDSFFETRKVEVFRGGRMGYADQGTPDDGPTRLGTVPVPPFAEIASDPQFELEEIAAEEFETVWRQATGEPSR